MKKLALFLTLVILCTTLSSPVLAAPKESSSVPSSSSSEKSSSAKEEKSSSENASSSKTKDDKSSSGSSSGTSSGSGAAPTSRLAPPFADQLYSQAVYILNLDSGQEVWAKNEQERMYPASLTKIMTAIIALESGRDLDTETTSLKEYIQSELYNKRIDTLGGIYQGEELTIHDLLYAMLLQSANEAAMMIADYIGDGSIDLFCEMMNKKAKEIGANNTNFCNANGLFDENNYSTAYDLALIARYAMNIPEFKEIVTTNAYTSKPTNRHPDGITWYTLNLMQKSSNPEYYYEGLQGVKTGSLPIEDVGGLGIRNFASTATRNGYTYLIILLGAPINDAETGNKYDAVLTFYDAKALYDWLFETFTVKTLMEIGKEVAEVPVRLSWDTDHISLLAADKFASLVPNETTSDSVTPVPVIPESVDAPIKKGQVVGYAKLMLNGLEVGRVDLVAGQKVDMSKSLFYLDKVKSFFSTFIFKFIFTLIIVVLVLYIILMIIRNRNMRRYKMRRRRPPQNRR